MIPFLSRLWFRPKPAEPADDAGYFATQFADHHDETRLFVHWSHRAPDLRARPYDAELGVLLLIKHFGQDGPLARLEPQQIAQMGSYLEFVQVDRGQQIMGQDEQGDHLLIVLQGLVAEDRLQPTGVRVRLGEAQPGDLLGEMSVLDGGTRFSTCHALTPVTLAVLSVSALEQLGTEEPRLALALMGWLARRLSLRLRQVSARLSVQLTRAAAH